MPSLGHIKDVVVPAVTAETELVSQVTMIDITLAIDESLRQFEQVRQASKDMDDVALSL